MGLNANARSAVAHQYRSPINLSARTALHSRFSTNPQGWFPWVFGQFVLPNECRILEIGCGTGELWLANRHRIPSGWRLVLTDASDGMIETTKGRLGGLAQVEAFAKVDAQSIPYPDCLFDAVIANHMLYHVPDLDLALSEADRVLKPGGTLFASTIGRGNMREFHELLESCAGDASSRLAQESITGRFCLENGEDLTARWFASVDLVVYQDGLAVTEVSPLVDYAQSLAAGQEPVLLGQSQERFKRVVEQAIRLDGAFHITKSAGMFVARKVSSVFAS